MQRALGLDAEMLLETCIIWDFYAEAGCNPELWNKGAWLRWLPRLSSTPWQKPLEVIIAVAGWRG